MNRSTEKTRRRRAITERRAEELAALGKVLAEPLRVRLLDALQRNPDGLTAGELTNSVDGEQTLVSYHLKSLRDAGVVNADRGVGPEWRTIRYTLNQRAFEDLLRWLD